MDNRNNQPRLSKQVVESATDYCCESCSHNYFVPVFALKKISAIMSPTGQEINFPVQTFACAKCGNVNSEFVPKTSDAIP